jgi:flagellar biosynthesis protein FlhA
VAVQRVLAKEAVPSPGGLSIIRMNVLQHPDILMSLAVVGVLMIMLLPLPRFALDVLLAFNITLAIIVLLVGMQVRKPLEFSFFCYVLLLV